MLLKRNDIMFIAALVMTVSLFISRAAMSISLALIVISAFATQDLRQLTKNFFASPFLISITLLFVVPMITGLWSENIQSWLDSMRTKLPLLLLPFAFAGNFEFSTKQWKIIAMTLILLVFAGSVWTLGYYLNHLELAEDAYLRSQTLPTPFGGDHVRFSWIVALSIFIIGWLFAKTEKRNYKIGLLILAVWLIIFLHILAARTGLIAFYFIAFAFVLRFSLFKLKPFYRIVTIFLLLALPWVAYLLFPTFQNRIKFISYDYGFFKEAHYLPGGNDAIRVISFKAGMETSAIQPLTGHGFGDINEAIQNWYETKHPEILPNDRIMPSSEFLVYAVGAGIPGLVILLIALLIPFFVRVRDQFSWRVLNIVIAFPFLYDVGLEVQYGIFIYISSVLFLWKWFTANRNK